MTSNKELISRFAASAQRRLIVTKIISQVAIYSGILSIIASLLNVLFIFLPFSFILYLFDTAVLLSIVMVPFFCMVFIGIRRISKLDSLRYLEKQSRIEHGIVSIALEMSGHEVNFFTKRVADTAVSQIKILKTFFPSFSKVGSLLVFSVGVILFTVTSLLQNTAIHYVSISDIFKNRSYQYVVNPGTINIPKGKDVVVSMESSNQTNSTCWLMIKDISTGKAERRLIYRNKSNVFSDTLVNVIKSLQYQFIVANKKINKDSIIVVHPPGIQSILLKVAHPSYMKRFDTVTISGNGNASVYRGSKVILEIESSFLKSASVVIKNDTHPMQTKERKASLSFNVTSTERIRYSIGLVDTMGQKNESVIQYEITILPDEPPVVQVTEPAFNKNLTPEMLEKIAFDAVDDFGIRDAELDYFINSNRMNVSTVKLSPKNSTVKYQKEYLWNLGTTGLYPGDTLFYFVKVTDNYPYYPAHSVSSDTFFFRIPSFEEITRSIQEKEEHAEQLLKEAIDKSGEIRKTAEKIKGETKNSSASPSWEQIQLLDQMKEQVAEQQDSLQKAIDELNKSAEELRKQGELGQELAEKMEQIKQMIEKLASKYGDSLFTDIDKNQKITAKQLQEAVEKAKEILPDLEDALDNTLRYLEAMQKDRELAELSMKAENLSREQVALNEQDTGDKREKQNEVINESGKLNSDIRKALDKNINENIESLLKKIDSLGKELTTQKNGAASADANVSTSMSQSLMSLSDELREMMSNAQMIKADKELKKVLKIAGMLLSVNEWIAELGRKQIDDKMVGVHLQVFSDALRKVQIAIDSLELIPPEMLSHMTKQVNTILNELKKIISTFDSFQIRNLDDVSSSLLVLANDLLSFNSQASRQQNNGGGGSGGMASKMRKLSQRQSGVNAATSAMLRSLMENKLGMQAGSGGMSSNGDKQRSEDARKAAMERQKEIADELAELQKEYARDNADSCIVKKLEDLKKEAQRLTEMFSSPTPLLEEKQNEFLNRMLQSALSVNKRDEEKEERKSESAKSVFSEQNSNKLQVPSTPDAFYLMKRKALQGNFPETYRNAINAYLDSLGILYLKDK